MKTPRKANVWLFFASVYVLSALLYIPILLSGKGMTGMPLNTLLMAIITFVPSGMGILFTTLTKNREERKDFWRRVFRFPRGRTKMAFAGMFILPIVVVISFLISSYINRMPISLPYAVDVLTNWKSLFIFLFVEFTFGAVSEELGWRGYALDELQTRWNALTSSLVLGLVWGFWHTPAFLIPGLSQHEMGGIFSWNYVAFLAMPVMGSILHTWIYNNTGRSILVAGILMHFMQNALMIFLGGIFDRFKMPAAYYAVLAVVLGLVSILVVIVWGPETLARRPVDRLSHLVQRTT